MLARLFRFISSVVRSVWHRFTELAHDNHREVSQVPMVVKLLILGLTAMFVFSVINFALHTITSLIGITIISIFINKIIRLYDLKLKRITKDLADPIINLPVFVASAFIYYIAPEIAIILGFIIIPQFLADLYVKYQQYDQELLNIGRKTA